MLIKIVKIIIILIDVTILCHNLNALFYSPTLDGLHTFTLYKCKRFIIN